jgi:hypothetical protein
VHVNWNTAERAAFLATLAGTIAWSLASISYPMGYDQGIMASVGDAITKGGFPYRDALDLKGPLAFYIFALVQELFGRVMWGIRLFDVGLLVTSGLFFYSLLKRIGISAAISRWIALSFVLAVASRGWFHVSQPDGWAAELIVIAVSVSIGRPRVPKIAWITSGILIGASALLKPFYIVFLALPIAIAIPSGLGAAGVAAVSTTAGALMPILAMWAWFGVNGAFRDLIAVHFAFNLEAYGGPESGDLPVVESLVSYLLNGAPRTPAGPFAVLLVPIVAGTIRAWKDRRGAGLALLVWLAAALACVTLQGKFFVFHWLVAFPPFLAMAALTLSQLSLEGAVARTVAAAAIGVFVCGVAMRPAKDTMLFARYAIGLDSRDDYLGRFERFEHRPLSAERAALFLKNHTRPDETVQLYGMDATAQYLSERASATRFVFCTPLDVPNQLYRDKYRAEFMGDLRRAAPRYVVLGSTKDEAALASFPELKQLLTDSYKLETSIGLLKLYRLKDSTAVRD